MVRAAIDGSLEKSKFTADPIFGVEIPDSCPHVPDSILHPRTTWTDPAAYDRAAKELAGRFHDNFAQFSDVAEAIRAAGPRNRLNIGCYTLPGEFSPGFFWIGHNPSGKKRSSRSHSL